MLRLANLTLRFVLELAGLAAMAWWGFATQPGVVAWLAGLGIPVAMAALWGIFRVPNDGGAPVVITPPRLRLLFEAVFFGLALGLLYTAGQPLWAAILLVALIVSYVIDYRRTADLLMGRVPATNIAAEAFGVQDRRR